ncbi:hypothetical protein BUALT_Bualt05G0125400 [Buddleja alternifolia]|uniref:Uncharacterized protein n=1 Tax=Buddleja alternifolia TaxID=168488 RepID=A0AAV6XIQ5_9LAMI|nr:hypothetical protein BUALT_Bualt05G0125400 [Buddleja alternifolia]
MNKARISKSRSRNSYELGGTYELRRGPWTLEEDNLLTHYISCNGEGQWNLLAKCAGLKRKGNSCRLRWLNYLKPDIKRGNLSPHEQLLILELHSKWGNRWSKIAQHLPGRTDNEIKNYWRTRVQKQARKLKGDSNSNNFLEAIRMFWMQKMLENIEQKIPSPALLSSCSMETQSFIGPSPVISYQGLPPSPCQTKPGNMVHNSDNNSISELPESVTNLTGGGNSLEDNSYYVGLPSYDMQELERQDVSVSGSHMADVDWFGEDLGGTIWGIDELW